MQGYLSRKRTSWKEKMWTVFSDESSTWHQQFYVLTNIGLLAFDEDNFLKPAKMFSLKEMKVSGLR
jgi:hypothetical protein